MIGVLISCVMICSILTFMDRSRPVPLDLYCQVSLVIAPAIVAFLAKMLFTLLLIASWSHLLTYLLFLIFPLLALTVIFGRSTRTSMIYSCIIFTTVSLVDIAMLFGIKTNPLMQNELPPFVMLFL